jgi:hypothetical protein
MSPKTSKIAVANALVAALALTGCAVSPFPVIDAKIDALKGKPITTLMEKFGDPTEQNQAGAEKIYIWSLAHNFDAAFQAVGFSCTIQVFVGKDGKIAHYSYDGNFGGCARYAHRLDNNFHLAQGLVD